MSIQVKLAWTQIIWEWLLTNNMRFNSVLLRWVFAIHPKHVCNDDPNLGGRITWKNGSNTHVYRWFQPKTPEFPKIQVPMTSHDTHLPWHPHNPRHPSDSISIAIAISVSVVTSGTLVLDGGFLQWGIPKMLGKVMENPWIFDDFC